MPTEYQQTLTGSYDRFFRKGVLYVGERAESGYANMGLFLPDTADFSAACDNMMAKVADKFRRNQGPLLDVGCGLGGTTEYLARYFPVDGVYGINVSDYQIEQCRARVPEAHFEVMPAENMRFPDAMFDALVSVEAALHFKGRREFLDEARRVLKPGGEIVVADMVFQGEPRAFPKVLAGQECYPDLATYRALWESCGFADIEIEDITDASWRAYVAHFKSKALAELLAQRIDAAMFNRLLLFVRNIEELPVLSYVVVSARNPA
ncbi:class I SAM-dependent methyltransferase [Sphingomonas sp.]|jgi:MPBQ/MSBQ methyltransferase|uniref:class I SAM-dependent methyltransferase n=1 Tax=Sphingomonas sp. TaxID=28214 RepID=UPI0017F9227E|nr:class I SAM-dependent methyltransferase [Sphingomonas sp.]MBA4761183.1 methyltransferase domain-containing protein [Sphingomonas sp.]